MLKRVSFSFMVHLGDKIQVVWLVTIKGPPLSSLLTFRTLGSQLQRHNNPSTKICILFTLLVVLVGSICEEKNISFYISNDKRNYFRLIYCLYIA